jgi:uncharacterized protein (TIGR01244 family)
VIVLLGSAIAFILQAAKTSVVQAPNDADIRSFVVGDTPNAKTLDDYVYFGGQPSESGLHEFAQLGVTTVINLRTEPEVASLAFDEPELAKSLGMRYVNVPIGRDPLSDETITDLVGVIAEASPGKTLIHCASGNRTGFAWSLFMGTEGGLAAEDAISEGIAAGLESNGLKSQAAQYLDRHGPAWTERPKDALTSSESEQLDRAHAAQKAVFESLMTTVSEAVSAKGHAQAIESCSGEAGRLTERAGEAHGVSIGRTALRLRNPNNLAPFWARPAIAAQVEQPTYFARKDGRFAALLPIVLQKECVACHGPVDQLSNGVPQRLSVLYPDDEATGFVPGDLRGWFWVEVPASQER